MTALTDLIAHYTPRVSSAFEFDVSDYGPTVDGFEQLLEDAAEELDEDDPDIDNLLQAAGYVETAARPDATGARYRVHITATLDAVLTARRFAP